MKKLWSIATILLMGLGFLSVAKAEQCPSLQNEGYTLHSVNISHKGKKLVCNYNKEGFKPVNKVFIINSDSTGKYSMKDSKGWKIYDSDKYQCQPPSDDGSQSCEYTITT